MKALVKVGFGEDTVKYMDIPKPEVRPGWLVVKVAYVGICGSDLHLYKDEYNADPPVVMGHEWCGTVEEVGEGVTDFKVGDRIVSMQNIHTCEACYLCRDGHPMLCADKRSLGFFENGAMAEYIAIPAKIAFHIPDTLELLDAVVTEPLACSVKSAIEFSKVIPGDYVFVSGPGTMGIMCAQLALACGARVMMSGTSADEARLNDALKIGVHEVVMCDKEDVEEKARIFTRGEGFDVVMECAGAAPSAATCMKVCKKRGRYNQVGIFAKAITIDLNMMFNKELQYSASYSQRHSSWSRALRILDQKVIDIKPIISEPIPLSEWKRGFDMAFNKEALKVIFDPSK